MQVSKWGNSLAVRFPASLVQALDLKEGEEIDLHLVGTRSFEVVKKPSVHELLARLHQFRGRQMFILTGLRPTKVKTSREPALSR
jgi:antitoxin MazE